ncbi:MAG: energy transducer TonB [Bacteroidia bacterium]|nr:energy transducer TonB [Bacteroidia bacterium]MCF8427715.1 energy transducer TonB [Bacteroidia bacterium]
MKSYLIKFSCFILLFISFNTLFAQITEEKAQSSLEKSDSSVSKIMTYVEEMPEFPGGTNALYTYITTNLVYPKEMQELKKETRVIATFVITKEGKITQAVVSNSVPEPFAVESLRLINSMPDWKPGKQNGKPVNVKFTLPIRFKLN